MEIDPLMIHYIALSSLALFLMMFGVWLVSIKLQDASIVDRVWGLNFVVIAIVYALEAGLYWRSALVFVLVCIWGLRLSLHIHRRNSGHGEDYRYRHMRAQNPDSFWWQSFFRVFLD